MLKRARSSRRKPAPVAEVPGPRRITTSDVARWCSVNAKTIHNWVNKGTLPALRSPSGHLRFERASLVAFLNEYSYPVPTELTETK